MLDESGVKWLVSIIDESNSADEGHGEPEERNLVGGVRLNVYGPMLWRLLGRQQLT